MIFLVFQSGFKTQHSTETAHVRFFNYILLANDSGNFVILMLLDLRSLVDTGEHSFLLVHLEY